MFHTAECLRIERKKGSTYESESIKTLEYYEIIDRLTDCAASGPGRRCAGS